MRAVAYVVGADTGAGASLKELARQIGFEAVQDFRSVRSAEKQAAVTPLAYFLFAAVPGLDALKPVAASIRASDNPRIKFAPLVYFADVASIENIRRCIDMGFDDIITLPFTLGRVSDRLDRQIDRPLAYFETPTYFGPDRHGRLGADDHPMAGSGGGQFRRMEIVRNPATGVNVIKDDAQIVL